MRRYDRTRQLLALGLAFLAGEVDAVGFRVAGGYFTSFMSGNTTRLGVELLGSATLPSIPLLLIGCFVTGVTAGTLVAIHFPGRHSGFCLDASPCGSAPRRSRCFEDTNSCFLAPPRLRWARQTMSFHAMARSRWA